MSLPCVSIDVTPILSRLLTHFVLILFTPVAVESGQGIKLPTRPRQRELLLKHVKGTNLMSLLSIYYRSIGSACSH